MNLMVLYKLMNYQHGMNWNCLKRNQWKFTKSVIISKTLSSSVLYYQEVYTHADNTL